MMIDNDDLIKYSSIREEIINIVSQESNESGESPKIVFLREMLNTYLSGLTSEWEDDPNYYMDERIQASHYSDDWVNLDILISDYFGSNHSPSNGYSTQNQLKKRFKQAQNLINFSLDGHYDDFDESDELRELARSIYNHAKELTRIRYILVTDKVCYTPDENEDPEINSEVIDGYNVEYQVWTIEKFLAISQSIRDIPTNLEIDLESKYGETIPCIKVDFENTNTEYESYLGYLKGDLLAKLYRDYNTKLLEGNIRVFLQTTPINKGIMHTLSAERPNEKTRFFAYNNGISATAESVLISETDANGRQHIKKVRGLQIVNGGQTTASIHSAWKKNQKNIAGVYLQIKLTVPNGNYDINDLNNKIAKYSNTQNQIKQADFSANDSFQVALERLSRAIPIPGKDSFWFYERVRGQYNEGSRLYQLKGKREQKNEMPFDKKYPTSRKIVKTDLAIYHNTWKQLPNYAVRGGEKNFQKFLEIIEAEYINLDLVSDNPKEKYRRYFRELISMAILFISTNELVAEWQNGSGIYGKSQYEKGYKRETVVYSLSLLSYLTKNKLNLEKIWDGQISHGVSKKSIKMPNELEKFLIHTIIPFIERELRATSADVREVAKKDTLWINIKEKADNLGFSLSQDIVDKYCLNEQEYNEREKWLSSLKVIPEIQDTLSTTAKSSSHDDNNPDKETVSWSSVSKSPSSDNYNDVDADVSHMLSSIQKELQTGSVMQLSKLLSTLQTKPEIDDDSLQPLRRIIAIRRSHHTVPQNLIEEFLQNLKNNSETNLLSNKESSITSKETDNGADDKQIYDESFKSPVFEARSRKGGSGKLIVGENGEFILLKGSVIPLIDTPSMRPGLINKRDKWIADSSIVINQDKTTATLAVDIVMHSSSEAAQLITANSTNGKTYWKCNGITLDDYLKKMGIND